MPAIEISSACALVVPIETDEMTGPLLSLPVTNTRSKHAFTHRGALCMPSSMPFDKELFFPNTNENLR